MEKAKFYLKNSSEQKQALQKLSEDHSLKNDFIERIVIKDGSKIIIIPAENITRIEAQDDYVMIHSNEGKFLKQKTMKYFEKHLNPFEFIRIHRSHIVSISKINKIELLEKESYQIVLKDGQKLPVSKTGYAKLKQVLNN